MSTTFPHERCFCNGKINYKLIKKIPIASHGTALAFAEVTEGKVPEGLKVKSRFVRMLVFKVTFKSVV